MPRRLEQLQQWLSGRFGSEGFAIAPASSDASFRRYFRVSSAGHTFIVMDAPPDKEDCGPYIRVARAFHDAGLNVPQIVDSNLDDGFLLLTDLGTRLYLDALAPDTVRHLYGDAIEALVRLQVYGQGRETFLPVYDGALLEREMELFREWYLGRHLSLTLEAHEHRTLTDAFAFLAASALEQPRVWVHRDYHSRNLMVTAVQNPGVLDFQDAVTGPITYDLVSLLRDCYIAWPDASIQRWIEHYHGRAQDAGLLDGITLTQLVRWFDLMGAQRHLKAIGIFARLNYRDGKSGYLGDIPRTLGYLTDVSRRFAELDELRCLVERRASHG